MAHTEYFKSIGKRLSNWRRWGADDERGTLNLITPETVVAAGRCIRSGKCFELSIPLCSDGPQTGLGGRVNPLHFVTVMPTEDLELGDGLNVSDDFIAMPLQGATQWDSLAHLGYDDRFYNDVPIQAVSSMLGATRNGIDRVAPGVVGRGVLVDLPRHRGVEWLDAGDTIEAAELEAVLGAQGVAVDPGTILAVRTGWRRRALTDGWDDWLVTCPGLGVSCAEWLHHHQIAAVVSDNATIEVQPAPDGQGMLPLHCILIRDMGMLLGEIFDLEALAADCASDGVWDFFLSAPPLKVVGGVGSPVSPVAIK